MSEFYTNVRVIGNNICYRGVNEYGQPIKFKYEYSPKVYVPSNKESTFKTLDGKYVDEMVLGSIKETRDFIKRYEEVDNFDIFGDIGFDVQYISDKFQNDVDWDIDKISIHIIDIETASENVNAVSHKLTAPEEILLISMTELSTKKVTTFTSREYTGTNDDNAEIILCQDEYSLLNQFLDHWNRVGVDIISGWNIDGFDIPYLINRISNVMGDDHAKRLSPWKMVTSRKIKGKFGKDDIVYDIAGVSCLDFMQLYLKFTYVKRESYTLDYICQVELGKGKLDHSEFATFKEFYTKGFNKFIDYNIIDTIRVIELEDKLKLIELCLTMSYLAKINYNDVFSQIRMWDSIIYNHLKHQNIVIPKKASGSKAEQFEGAFVQEPIPGLYNWVVSFDATSLYPSIMQTWNISPETYMGVDESISVSGLMNKKCKISDKYATAANGAMYKRDKKGLLPELIDIYMGKRRSAKNSMIEAEKKLEELKKNKFDSKSEYKRLVNEISKFNNEQMAFKIGLNSLYGAIGNAYCRYFELENARAITLTGQYIIKTVGEGLNRDLSKLFKIDDYDWSFYSDTDSVVGTSIIHVNNNKITISDFYDSLPEKFIKYDNFNNNYVKIVDSESYSALSLSDDKILEMKPIQYIMKHKIKKELFKIKNSNGDEVIVTEDHSIIVEEIHTKKIINIKPKKLNPKFHKIINVTDTDSNVEFDDGYTVESLGVVDEWVYDIEVEDNHNFFANNILVHNSCYISLKPMVNKFYKDLSNEKLVNIIDKISKEKITPIINKCCLDLQTYTNSYRNMIYFKQEGISSNGVWVAKKRYFLNVLDNEGVRYASPKLKVMGLEVVKSSTPGIVREKLKTCLSLILDNKEDDLQNFIEDFKSQFKSLPVEDIASPRGVNGIEKYSNSGYKDDDLNNFIEASEAEPNRSSIKKNPISNAGYNSGCPLHTKGAIIYNKKLKEMNLDNIYPIVGEGDRIKYTYLKTPNPIKDIVISFPSELPKEFKLEKYIDYDKQFDKTFLEPIKSILQILDWTTEKTNSIEDFFS